MATFFYLLQLYIVPAILMIVIGFVSMRKLDEGWTTAIITVSAIAHVAWTYWMGAFPTALLSWATLWLIVAFIALWVLGAIGAFVCMMLDED